MNKTNGPEYTFYSDSCVVPPCSSTSNFPKAVELAKKVDVVILLVGLDTNVSV